MKSSILVIALMAIFTSSVYPQPKPGYNGNPWNKNQVIAHRGAWKKNNVPENSIASLKEAIKLGCYGSEFDVHMTADSILVVNHNADFYGLPIATLTYKDLLEKKHPNGESIPTLESYLKEGMKQKKMKLILEIKVSNLGAERDQIMADHIVATVKKMKAEAWVDYISFGYDLLKRVLVLQPKAKVAYLSGDVALEKLKQDGFYGADYHYSVYQKGEWFAKAKELDLTINAWTVDAIADMKWLLENKVEFITTNEPEMLFDVIKAEKK